MKRSLIKSTQNSNLTAQFCESMTLSGLKRLIIASKVNDFIEISDFLEKCLLEKIQDFPKFEDVMFADKNCLQNVLLIWAKLCSCTVTKASSFYMKEIICHPQVNQLSQSTIILFGLHFMETMRAYYCKKNIDDATIRVFSMLREQRYQCTKCPLDSTKTICIPENIFIDIKEVMNNANQSNLK